MHVNAAAGLPAGRLWWRGGAGWREWLWVCSAIAPGHCSDPATAVSCRQQCVRCIPRPLAHENPFPLAREHLARRNDVGAIGKKFAGLRKVRPQEGARAPSRSAMRRKKRQSCSCAACYRKPLHCAQQRRRVALRSRLIGGVCRAASHRCQCSGAKSPHRPTIKRFIRSQRSRARQLLRHRPSSSTPRKEDERHQQTDADNADTQHPRRDAAGHADEPGGSTGFRVSRGGGLAGPARHLCGSGISPPAPAPGRLRPP